MLQEEPEKGLHPSLVGDVGESWMLEAEDDLQPRPPLGASLAASSLPHSTPSSSIGHSSSVIAEYIRRFRYAEPTPPSLRDQPASRDAFWWLQPAEQHSQSVSSSKASVDAKTGTDDSFHVGNNNKGKLAWFGLEEILSHAPLSSPRREESPPRPRSPRERSPRPSTLDHSGCSDSGILVEEEEDDDLQEYAKKLLSKCEGVLALYRQDRPQSEESPEAKEERKDVTTTDIHLLERAQQCITEVSAQKHAQPPPTAIKANIGETDGDNEEGDHSDVGESWTSERVREALLNLSVEDDDVDASFSLDISRNKQPEPETRDVSAQDTQQQQQQQSVSTAMESPKLLPSLQQPPSSMSPLMRSLNLSIASPYSPATQSQQSSVMFLSSSSEDFRAHAQPPGSSRKPTDIAFRSLESLDEMSHEGFPSPEEKDESHVSAVHAREDDEASCFPLHNDAETSATVVFDEDLARSYLSDPIVAQLYARLQQVRKDITRL